MEKFDNRFGFFAPKAPEKRVAPTIDSPLLLGELIKADGEQADCLRDPVGAFISKAQGDAELAKSNSTVSDEQLTRLICAPADVRGPVALAKAASGAVSDWGWDTPISDTLRKRATHGTARERFRQQLQEFFRGHDEELAEAHEVVSECLADELSAIEAEAA